MEVGAQSSIIEENLAAADRTMGSFCPATVGSFLVNSISQGFRWRSESFMSVISQKLLHCDIVCWSLRHRVVFIEVVIY